MRASIIFAAYLAAIGLSATAATPALAEPQPWTGTIRVNSALVYSAPGGAPLGTLDQGSPVSVLAWQYGPGLTSDNYTWADVGDGRFVHSSVLQHSPLPPEAPKPLTIGATGHWADANLTQQILTLYDGDRPIHMALMNSGRPGGPDTESHPGVWTITTRVANETMRGEGYDISGVLFTQYFTPDAEAIHLNYWLSAEERGIPRSHGCLGLAYDDALVAWNFLGVGSVVVVHA